MDLYCLYRQGHQSYTKGKPEMGGSLCQDTAFIVVARKVLIKEAKLPCRLTCATVAASFWSCDLDCQPNPIPLLVTSDS